MQYQACNENLIRAHGVDVLSTFYVLKVRNKNGVLYRDRVITARKMGVDRSTLSRWISTLIAHKLAMKEANGNVALLSYEQAIKDANEGRLPSHRCTLPIITTDNRQQIGETIRIKLLEEFHRQVQHASLETEIKQKTQEKYGFIHNNGIKEKVKSRVRVEKESGVPMSGKAIAKRIGTSEREWHHLRKRWTARKWISSVRNEESLGYMSADQYTAARDHFGFASKRKRTGEVVRINPNLIFLGVNYQKPSIEEVVPEFNRELTLDQCYFTDMEVGGRLVPFLVLPRWVLLK